MQGLALLAASNMCPGCAHERDYAVRRLRRWRLAVEQADACGLAAVLVRQVVENEGRVYHSLAPHGGWRTACIIMARDISQTVRIVRSESELSAGVPGGLQVW